MKHNYLKHLFTVLLLLCSITAGAHDFEVDGVYYKITNSATKEVAVTYKGNSYDEYSDEYSGSVVIPEIVVCNDETYSVTSIEVRAFCDCHSLTSVVIGNNVTNIGDGAFVSCHNLTSVVIGNSVASIESQAFWSCSNLISIEIPNSVTSIGYEAFFGCALISVEIPSSVTNIGEKAFHGTTWYNNHSDGVVYAGKALYKYKGAMPMGTSIAINEGTTIICHSAFSGCNGLAGIVIPSSVTTIGRDAFSGCSGLANVVIPNSVTSIGESAFNGCSGLANVVIPGSVTRIDKYAFDGCISLKELRIKDGESTLSLSYGTNFEGYIAGLFCNCPLETLYIGRNLSSDDAPFSNITTLKSVVISNSVTTIGENAFNGCISLKELRIEDGETTLSLGNGHNGPYIVGMFYVCPLETLYLGRNLSYEYDPFSNITTLESVVIGNSVTTIGGGTFHGTTWYNNQPDGVIYAGKILYNYKGTMPANASIAIKEGTTTICSGAFSDCSGFTSVEIPNSVTTINENAFNTLNAVFEFASEEPAVLGESAFHGNAVLVVPDEAVGAYKAAWNCYAAQIVGHSDAFVVVEVEAKESTSGIMERVGIDKAASVAKLTVKGSINSYDVIMFRDKMPLLRELDLSEATVVASDKAFYNGNCTKDKNLGDYAFYDLSKLNYVKLPNNLESVGSYAFYGCSSLREIEVPEAVQGIGYCAFYDCGSLKSAELPKVMTYIGTDAFQRCSSLEEIVIPDGVKSLFGTFYNCSNLKKVILPDGIELIGYNTFADCNSLKEVKLPPTVKTIDELAFDGCSSLEEIRIPSSVQSIGDNAFNGCANLNKVYTYTVEPTVIKENTFSTFATATLYVPSFSFSNYYWDDGWKRFLKLEEFDEPYEYFYVNNDYVLDENTGYISGIDGNAPDADINAGGGFIVEGEQGDGEVPNQSLGNVNVSSDGNGTSASIIGDNNLHIDDLHIKINVNGGRWYFFAFPFDIRLSDISMENGSDYVFRYYDGEERAANGNGGWKDVDESILEAACGYIFQCSADDVLVLSIKDVKFKKEDKYNELVAHVSDNLKDASWNFVGNPYLSYYDLADMDYSAPVTVWDGEKYVAIRPGDDDYHFAPYEAFFVQKPEGQESIAYDGEEQMTKNQSDSKKEKQSAARRARSINPDRLLINLVLDNCTSNDRTRIVFNERQSLGYETACDASKFETKGVAQLYTIGRDKVHYAINERPADNGVVMLGYTAPTAGFYTIEAQRMDAEVFVKDYKTGVLHNLNDGAYSFSTDAGTFNERFEILLKGTAPGTTGIDEVEGEPTVDASQNGEVKADIYDLQGRKMQDAGKGIYIINGEKILK
ncbi:MAG: leucine-rich repeat protein [Bacteroidaceae bacterium]|nr:leucine-rich repeat protein [Bacteroidaceae bacterium]